jgi:5-methylcytosine-specific restriction enzyme B
MNKNYWHIQLHPDEKLEANKIRSILTNKQVIGMGDSWNYKNGNPANDPKYFMEDMRIGDVVMVRDGSTPVALVKVIGDAYIEANVDDNLDWFTLRRKIELLGFFDREEKQFLDEILKNHRSERIQAQGTLTRCSGINATKDFIVEWNKRADYKKLMENIKLSAERQNQIKALWDKYKTETKEEDKTSDIREIDDLIVHWNKYKDKITSDTLSLDDYTNKLGRATATMPGGYLCNFLERTTRTVLGSSKPGTAFGFEVKLNDDNSTYSIKQDKPKANREEAETYFNENIKALLKSIVLKTDPLEKIRLVEEATYRAKQILMKLAVLDNLTDFLYIYSEQSIEGLYNDFIDGEAEGIFTKNYQVCLVAKSLLSVNEQDKGELILLSRFLWRYMNAKTIADVDSPNVIMYGPPGTGKTYSVVNSLDFVSQGDSSRYEVLQFHPSFTYEDFIEGIKPKGVSKDGNIRFELVNGVFKNFCIKAKKNPSKSFYFVVDEINRANLSSVFGETLSLLEKDYRHDGTGSKNLIKTQYSALIEDLIREDDKYQSLAYIIDKGEVKFGVPENVFFIGMMNDVDKSIDAFDLALRRRFKWIRKDCDYEVVEQETRFKQKEEFSNIGQYIKACEKLNNYISSYLGLGKSYEFGHSFFMKMSGISKRKEITQHNMETLFNLYLRPTLKEYLRAVFAESELDGKLDQALNLFSL